MKAATNTMRLSKVVALAQKAYAQGDCLKAGKYIDDAYRLAGVRRLPSALKKLDERFERTCVRKHPKFK